jgi:SulP family sulfate permease
MKLISQGIGNVASVFFGGFSATGAIARTATNIRAGAMSSISAIVHSLFLVAVVMWLLPLIELIPLAALASVLVIVAYDMSDLRTVRHIFQGPKSDWSVMLLTFALTVVFDLTVAVYSGVILASLLFMRRINGSPYLRFQGGRGIRARNPYPGQKQRARRSGSFRHQRAAVLRCG